MNLKTASIKRITTDAIMTTLLILAGMIKIPSFVQGAEFQLSAPLAICIVSLLGFKRYLGIGICSSCIQLMLGTHTIFNVTISMVFRIVAGTVVTLFPHKKTGILLAGPLGTAMARIVLAQILHIPAFPLLGAAIPGMIFTVACVFVLLPVLKGIGINTFLPKE